MGVLAESTFSVGDLTALIGIAVFITTALGGIVTYLLRRRGSTGQIATSDAATLWTQSQALMAQLAADKAKAEDQRDRLIQIQSDQVVPALAAVNESLKQIMAVTTAVLDKLSEVGRG
jgi:hypothetical protein